MNDLVPVRPATIPADVADLVHASIAPGTRRVYASVLGNLNRWRDGRTLNDALLAAHLADLHRRNRSPSRCALTVAAVNLVAKLNQRPSPAGLLTERTLAGIRRSWAPTEPPVQGVRHERVLVLTDMIAQEGTNRSLRDASLIALGADALLRTAEIAALEVPDLAREPDGTGRLTLRRSKTDQESRGKVLFVGQPTMNLLRRYLEATAVRDGRLFRSLNRAEKVSGPGLSARSVRTIIQSRLCQYGVDGRVSGHSLRIGTARSLAAAGAGLAALMEVGRWKSPTMPAHYARGELAGRGAVARLLYHADGNGEDS